MRRLLKKNSTYPEKLGAILAGSLLVATTVYAVYSFGLRNLHLGKENVLDLSERNSWADEIAEKDIPTREVDLISLGGIAESPEYQACSEWRTFQENYDTDGGIRAEIGNGFAGLAEEYELEMEYKIDEICEKYGLSLLSGFQVVDSNSDLLDKSGIGGFCVDSESAKHNTLCGYLYSDGTFMIEGNVTLAGSSMCEAGYQFAYNAKGTFNPAYLDFGDYTGYSVREYTTKRGETVYIICKADENAHILTETEKSYVSIGVLGDLSGISDVNDERLELFADAFDFSVLP